MVSKIIRFDEEIDDGEGNIIASYHGYNIIIDDIVVRKYDSENCVYVCVDMAKDIYNIKWTDLEMQLWKMGYDAVYFQSTNGYKELAEIRKWDNCPMGLRGGPKYLGNTCPQCGNRLFRKESNHCNCGWINKSAQQGVAPEPVIHQ